MTTKTENGKPRRLPSLTGARWIAALLVFLSHVVLLENLLAKDATLTTLTRVFGHAGSTGVEFFFILSGFMLAWAARPGERKSAFWRRRFFKIYPIHLVTWGAGLFLAIVFKQADAVGNPVPSLFLLHSWLPTGESPNSPSWSLSCEFFFYLMFPLLLGRVNRIRETRLMWCAGGVALVVIALPFLAQLLPSQPSFAVNGTSVPAFQFYAVYFLPLARVPEFLLGIVVARLVLSGRFPAIAPRSAILFALVVYIASFKTGPIFGVAAPMVIPLAVVIGSLARADIEGRSTRLASPRFVWLGEASFAFYLVHWMVLHYGHIILGGGTYGVAVATLIVVVLFVVSLGLSAALLHYVERPIMSRFSTSKTSSRIQATEAMP
ncbi:acyltransferase family protein [Streptomyces sp. NPDC003032]